ncbi:MAG: chemotaxis protein CheA [Thermoanaerobaculia bacterium]|nr:chemotaxis protein CheA [Thermoanaerobaculia bacterium]
MTAPGRRDEARLRREFLAEAEELLERAAEAQTTLYRSLEDPDPAALNDLFRSIHSLKGAAGMVGLKGLSSVAHELESLLDAARLGKVELTAAFLGTVTSGVDSLSRILKRVNSGESDPETAQEVLASLQKWRQEPNDSPAQSAPAPVLPAEVERMMTDYERHRFEENTKRDRGLALLALEFPLETFDLGLRKGMDEVGSRGELIGTFPGGVASDPNQMTFRLLAAFKPGVDVAAVAREAGAVSYEILRPVPRVQEPPEPRKPVAPPEPKTPVVQQAVAPEEAPARSVSNSLRVSTERIASLLALAGDLGLARWALRRPLERALASATDRQARFEAQRAFAELDRTVTAIGRAALAIRLVPVEQMTSRLIRAVESIARTLEKKVQFEAVTGDTEVDKTLADELADPLLHLVRNALDHGIESPAERRKAKKALEGTIRLTAETHGREVVFRLSDDGRGIDPERLIEKARSLGLIRPSDPDPVDPLDLIFLPGFSTAADVTELSGRGVGLDVVRSNLTKIKGRVQVWSRKGEGTTFEVVIPMTLVLVESLLVRCADVFFALASSGVRRTFTYDPAAVEVMDGQSFVGDEGFPLPVFDLATLLGLPGGVSPRKSSDTTVIVAEQGLRRAGFVVGAIEGMQDVVIKPLPDTIPRAREITGAAELPGGQLAFSLDTGLLLERVMAQPVTAGGGA